MPSLLQQGQLAGSAPNFNAYQPSTGLLPSLAAQEAERKRKEDEAKRQAMMDLPKPQMVDSIPLNTPTPLPMQVNQSRPVDFEAYKPLPPAPAPMSTKPTIRNQLTDPALDALSWAGNKLEQGYGAITEAPARLLAEPLQMLPPTQFDVGKTRINFDPTGAQKYAAQPIQGFMSQTQQALEETAPTPGLARIAPYAALAAGFMEPLGAPSKVGRARQIAAKVKRGEQLTLDELTEYAAIPQQLKDEAGIPWDSRNPGARPPVLQEARAAKIAGETVPTPMKEGGLGRTTSTSGPFEGTVPKLYHGASTPITTFDPKKFGTGAGQNFFGKAAYLTENPSRATEYGKILSEFDASKLKIIDAERLLKDSELEDILNALPPALNVDKQFLRSIQHAEPVNLQAVRSFLQKNAPTVDDGIEGLSKALQKLGYDGVNFRASTMGDRTYAIFRPQKLSYSPSIPKELEGLAANIKESKYSADFWLDDHAYLYTDEAPKGSKIAPVGFGEKDLVDWQQYAKGAKSVRETVVPISKLTPKIAGGKKGLTAAEQIADQAWHGTSGASKIFPPPTIELLKDGNLKILDGNHRVAFFEEAGYDYVPVRLVDKHGIINKLDEFLDANPSSDLTDFFNKVKGGTPTGDRALDDAFQMGIRGEKPPTISTAPSSPLLETQLPDTQVMGGNVVPPVPPSNSLQESVPEGYDAIKRLQTAIREADTTARPELAKIYKAERSRRAGAVGGIFSQKQGMKGYFGALKELKGELAPEKPAFRALALTNDDIDAIANVLQTTPKLGTYEKVGAIGAFRGLIKGQIPTDNEIELLSRVFPQEMIDDILAKRPLGDRMKSLGAELINLPRSMMATLDLSAPLRQGVFLVGKPKQWAPAVKDMFRFALSEQNYQSFMDDLVKRPTYSLMRDHGLSITDMASPNLTAREEQFMSNIAEGIPGFGKLARASNRAYSGFLNKLRADVFDDLITKAKALGVDSPETLDSVAKFVNAATGRGDIKSLNRAATVLNGVFFSPRLIMSRLNLLNPQFYMSLEPFARKEAIKSALSFGAIAGTVVTLAKMAGADVGNDPRSADFGKIKIDNTRYDPWGGFQQYIVAAYRLYSGEMVSSTTGREFTLGEGYKPTTRFDIIQRLFESKESPVASFITQVLKGKNYAGDPISIPAEVINRFIPMLVQDMFELIDEKGLEAAPMAFPGLFGVGSQTYTDQIPFKSKTASGEEKIDWRAAPSIGERIWGKVTGKELTDIPQSEWAPLQEERERGILRDIQLTKVKSEVLQTGESQMVDETLVYMDNGVVKTKKLNDASERKEVEQKLNLRSKINADEEYRTKVKGMYDRVKSFDANGNGYLTKAEKANRDAYLASLSEEDKRAYEEYGKIESQKKADNTAKVRDLLSPDPVEAVKYLRSLPGEEQDRIINEVLKDDEYEKLKAAASTMPKESAPHSSAKLFEDGSFTEKKDVKIIKREVLKNVPFSDMARWELEEARYGMTPKNKENALLQKGNSAAGEYTSKGLDYRNFFTKLPIKPAVRAFILNNTEWAQNLDKANINVASTEKSSEVMLHEMAHHLFEKSAMGDEFNFGAGENQNSDFFQAKFDEEWNSLTEKYPILDTIDTHIVDHYETENMDDASYATERYAYLAERVLEHGAEAIPPELRKYYKNVFRFE